TLLRAPPRLRGWIGRTAEARRTRSPEEGAFTKESGLARESARGIDLRRLAPRRTRAAGARGEPERREHRPVQREQEHVREAGRGAHAEALPRADEARRARRAQALVDLLAAALLRPALEEALGVGDVVLLVAQDLGEGRLQPGIAGIQALVEREDARRAAL